MAQFNTRSKLAVLLLEAFARGDLPATRVTEIAEAAWADGWLHHDPLAHALAHTSPHSGHKLQNLINAARNAGFMSSSAMPYEFDVRAPGGHAKQSLFLPHETYANLVTNSEGEVGQ